jgi:heat-inducible transcriptional repressor
MADLEELGFITQPHTSAGRIPTDKGYRYYVDSLMNVEYLSDREKSTITDGLTVALSSEHVTRDVSKVLGSLSHYLSVVRLPQVTRATIERIELYRLVTNKILVAVTLNSEVVRTITLEAHFEIDHDHLYEIQALLNERLVGRTLNFVRENVAEVVRDAEASNHALLRLFVDSAEKLFSYEQPATSGMVHIAGAQNLFDYPEFGAAERVRTIIELMESEEVIVHLLDSAAAQEGHIRIMIGQEMDSSLMGEYSLLTTQYRHAGVGAAGAIGLIGPKRMNYARMISIVQHVASVLAQSE